MTSSNSSWPTPSTNQLERVLTTAVGGSVYGDGHVRRILITDLDNTLGEWFEAWYQSFSALLNGLHEMTALTRSAWPVGASPAGT